MNLKIQLETKHDLYNCWSFKQMNKIDFIILKVSTVNLIVSHFHLFIFVAFFFLCLIEYQL